MQSAIRLQPALGLLELSSIAIGILVGDAMVKRSPVEVIYAGTVHPGKYLVLVAGDVAHVEEALPAGREAGSGVLIDQIYLPDAHPQVTGALRGTRRHGNRDALGVVETTTVAAIIGAADRAIKSASVELQELRYADHLGGKAYCMFNGPVDDVEAAVEVAVNGLSQTAQLVSSVVIPRIHDEMADNLEAAAEFMPRIGSFGATG